MGQSLECPEKLTEMVSKETALPGREESEVVNEIHAVNGNRTVPPFPDGLQMAMFGMGCFYGAEKVFWQMSGVYSTQVGYSGGFTKNPKYMEVCTGQTGHCEVVRVVYDPNVVSYIQLLKTFWENHNPAQLNRQGNDIGTQYRSAVFYYTNSQRQEAEESRQKFEKILKDGYTIWCDLATQIELVGEFYYAEDRHQQILHKDPTEYCSSNGLGVEFPTEAVSSASVVQ